MKIKFFPLLIFLLFISSSTLFSETERSLTIIHTNDLHSHLLGHSPNRDYTPDITGDDETKGGWARLAHVIDLERTARNNPVLTLDAGDFLMGTLFHMISREEAVELNLMGEMGYDVTTLGNHEFDLKPDGLARILESADRKGKMPYVVTSNVIFTEDDPEDDYLEEIFERGLVKPYIVLVKDGMKIGLFGLVGADAAEVAPFAWPVQFEDIVEASKKMVKVLREDEKVDLIVCLSHSGLREDIERSEDEILAQEVPDIDIIISGHTHTKLEEPIIIGKTIIVQAWEYGKAVGVLDVTVGSDGPILKEYKLVEIDDSIKGDPRISDIIESKIRIINDMVLKEHSLTFHKDVAETDFDLILKEEETGLGNMITDAIRWYVDKYEYDPNDPITRTRLSIQSNGVIRSDILVGETGFVGVSDLFRTVPLGIGNDDSMGYPLVSFYLYGSEIKKAMEVTTSIYPIKGSDYFLQLSGLKVTYNPNRMIFDRVTGILIEDENGDYVPLDYCESNKELYKIATNFYNASFIKVVGSFTNGILTMAPKDRYGNVIDDLSTVRVDADKDRPGIQELKDWAASFEYISTFDDTDRDGILEIPERYSSTSGRFVSTPSINPYKLVKGGNYLTWIAFCVVLLVIIITALIIYFVIRIIKRKKK